MATLYGSEIELPGYILPNKELYFSSHRYYLLLYETFGN